MTAAPVNGERTSARRHVHEIDVVRVLTFACVIAVHTTAHTTNASSVLGNGAQMLLHFTREAFFFLTGFVLMHQAVGRTSILRGRPLGVFWRKRFVAVGVPYLTWTLIYTLIQSRGTMAHFWSNVIYGTAWYHMYFLLVSMQIYLLFPLIEWLVRKTAGHHALLLLVSGALQIATTSWVMYFPPRSGLLATIVGHDDALIFSYQFYVLLGCVAAAHFEQTMGIVRQRRAFIAGSVVAGAALATIWYGVAVHNGRAPESAAAVLQPVVLPWACAAIAGLFVLGSVWNDRRRAGSFLDRALNVGSDRSFGVFLVHPAFIWLFLLARSTWFPSFANGLALTVTTYVLVVCASLVTTELFRRSPASLALTGRRRATTHNTPKRRESNHARNDSHPAGATVEAPIEGRDDGDRRRPADPLLR